MGIGMGALIAGLFGMNVSPVLLLSPFVARRTFAFFLRILPFSLLAIWRDIRLPSWECLPWLP
jgi:Mg2+ and Co2+ transporter CorA